MRPVAWNTHQKLAGRAAAAFLFVSLVLAPLGWGQGIECGGIKIVQALVIVIWLLAPPF